MALNIKNREVENLVAEVAEMAGETKTEAVRKALLERRNELRLIKATGKTGPERFMEYLETEVWPNLPPGVRGTRISKEEEEEILGIGPDGA